MRFLFTCAIQTYTKDLFTDIKCFQKQADVYCYCAKNKEYYIKWEILDKSNKGNVESTSFYKKQLIETEAHFSQVKL